MRLKSLASVHGLVNVSFVQVKLIHIISNKKQICTIQWINFAKRFVQSGMGQPANMESAFFHFSSDCFINTRQFSMGFSSQLMLTKCAVPTIFVE